MLPGVLHRCERARDRHGSRTHERRNATAVIERNLGRALATLRRIESLTRHGDVAVDRYRVFTRAPDGNEGAAGERAHAGFGIDRQQGGRQRAVDGVATGGGNFPGGFRSELRRGCDGDPGHDSIVNN